jgi:cell wall-associated NlpC family hydrolase
MKVTSLPAAIALVSLLLGSLAWGAAEEIAKRGSPRAPHATMKAEILFRLGWGDGEGQVGVREAPEGRYGPQALAVEEERSRIHVLDSVNERVLTFGLDGRAIGEIRVPALAEDIAPLPGDRLAVLVPSASALLCVSPGGDPCGRLDVPRRASPARGLRTLDGGKVVLWHTDNSTLRVSWRERWNGRVADAFAAGIEAETADGGRAVEVRRDQDGRATVRLRTGSVPAVQAEVPRRCGTVETVTPGGVSDAGRVVVAVEELCAGTIARFVRVVSEDGALATSAGVPSPRHAFVYRDLELGRGGAVYQLVVEADGVSVVRWSDGDAAEPTAVPAHPAPLAVFDERERREECPAAGPATAAAVRTDTVTLAEAMSRALAYATHAYTVGGSNLTPAAGASCGGKLVKTPTWLSAVGTMVGLPYKWGGFTGLEGFSSTSVDPDCAGTNTHFFDAALADGQYAGDTCASSCSGMYCGSHCAVGVDCSGYVSQVWELPGHVTTSMLASSPYTCPAPLPDYDALLPGDVLNHAGSHVRLFTARGASGAIEVLEASGRDWKVAPHAYQVAELASYVPYRTRAMGGVFASGERVVAADTAAVRGCADLTSPACAVIGQAARGQAGTITTNAEEHGGYLVWPVAWDGGPSGWVTQCVLGKSQGSASLAVLLAAEPVSGPPPLATTLTATVSGTATGALDLAVWWDCPHAGTDLAEVALACGALPAAAAGTCSAPSETGMRCSGVWELDKAFAHVYESAGEFSAKVLGSRAGLGAESRTAVSARATCSYGVSPRRAEVGPAGGGIRVEVLAPVGCAWTASSDAQWVRVAPAAGSGDGALDVTVDPNGSPLSRSAVVTVQGQSLAIEQSGSRPPRRRLPRDR